MNREYKPLKLMPNVIFATYQLHAEVANNETPPDDAMKIVILEVMAWLRERFRDLDIPQQIQLPEPADYQNFQLSELKPFKVDPGYIVEVGFRLEDRAWALELREPDLGPRPEDTGNNRKPAPGRTFTTNIAVRIHDGVVDCGFRTMVSELKGEKTPCESEEISIGGSDNVDAEVFSPFDYVALGHLHGPQQITRPTIRYAGTPLKYSFSEAGHSKSVTVVELYEKGNTQIRTVALTPKRDMREIKGSYLALTLRENYKDQNVGDYLQITLTDEEDIPDVIGKLRAIYPNIMKVDYDNQRTRQSAQVEVAI